MVPLPLQVAPPLAAPPLLSLPDTGSLYGRLVVVVLFLAVGMLGVWFNFALLSAAFSSGDDASSAGKVNCPSCGARTAIERATCDYCGEPMPEDSHN